MVYVIYIFELIVVNIVLIDWISLTFVKYNFMFANYNEYIYTNMSMQTTVMYICKA